MTIKNSVFIILLISVSLEVGWKIYDHFRVRKYNILIVSTCSLSYNRVGYNGTNNTPNIDQLASNSFIIDNAITDMSWSNVSGFLSKLTNANLKLYGYHAIGNPWSFEEESWQQLKKDTPTYYFRTPDSDRETGEKTSSYQDDINEVKKRVLDKKNWPFVLDLHTKVLHLPYGGPFYRSLVRTKEEPKKSKPIRYMVSPEVTDYINEYIDNMDKYPERIPFSIFLGSKRKDFKDEIIKMINFDKYTADSLRSTNAKNFHYIGIVNNRSVLDQWHKSKYFAKDVEVIKQIYDARLKVYDESLKDLLNYYHDPDFEKNTIIIFTGDHGEAFFEHDYMTHGETVFDEMIRFPLFIKFPGQQQGEHLKPQFYQEGISEIVEKIIKGELKEANFKEYLLKKGAKDFIFSRNCANDLHSIRYQNKWKLVWDLKKNIKSLYDLVLDPQEKINVYGQHLDVEAIIEENYLDTIKVQSENKMLHKCASGRE
jgi:hypothetical protein